MEEFEEVARAGQQEWQFGFLHIVNGQGYASIRQPQKTVFQTVEFCIFIESLQYEAFVFGIQFGRNQVEYVFDVEFVARVVLGNVAFV